MRCARAWTFASLVLLALGWGRPLVPMEGYPGEAKLLVFAGEGPVEVPEGFSLLLPPEAVDGVVSLVVRVPPLPPGEYPFRVGGSSFPFRILPQAKALLLPPPPVELGAGEEAWVEVGVRNLGNVPLPLKPQVVPVGVGLLRLEGPPSLDPGAEGRLRLLLQGRGSGGQVQVELLGQRVAILVAAKPAPPPPFWDWVRLRSRLVADTSGQIRLEGQGELPGLWGDSPVRVAYGLTPNALSLDLGQGSFGLTLGANPSALSLGVRFLPSRDTPFGLTFRGSTAGEARLTGLYAQGGLRASLEAALLPSFGVQASLGVYGAQGGLGYGAQASYQGGTLRLEGNLATQGFRLEGHGDTQGRLGVRGTASLGGGWNAGLGLRWDGEAWVTGVLGVPLGGTVEVRGEYGLASRRYRLEAFRVQVSPRERWYQQVGLDPEGVRLGLSFRLQGEDLGVEGGGYWHLGRGAGAQLALALPQGVGLSGRLSLGPDLRPTGWGLAASLALDLPLYPMPWRGLELRVSDPAGRPLAVPLVVGPYRYGTGEDGRLFLRLPPGPHLVRAPSGMAFRQEGRLVRELMVQAQDQTLSLTLLRAHLLTLRLRPCPPEREEPGRVYGLPGMDLETVLRRAAVQALAGGSVYPLTPGSPALVPEGPVALRLGAGLGGAYALADLEGKPLGPVSLGEDRVLEACLVPLGRPVEVQELPPAEEERP